MKDQIVGEFSKNAREVVRVMLTRWKGRRLVNLRVFYADAAGGWLPGRQGLCLDASQLTMLRDAVIAAMREAQGAEWESE